MRQTLAKGTRRELRRAIGSDAVDSLVEQRKDVGKIADILHRLQGDVIALERDYAINKQATSAKIVELSVVFTDELDRIHKTAMHDSQRIDSSFGLVNRGLVARFRWLFTGR